MLADRAAALASFGLPLEAGLALEQAPASALGAPPRARAIRRRRGARRSRRWA